MKNIFFTHSILICFLLVGCMQSQKESDLAFKVNESTNRTPASGVSPDVESPDALESEQVVKINPATCGNGWQLKNPTVINEHFKKAKEVLNSNSCLSCHNSSSKGYALLNYSSTEEMLEKKGVMNEGNLINPLELKKSLILTKLSNYGGSMPAVSETDLATLKEWIKSIDYECLAEKEIVKEASKQIKTADATIDQKITTYTTTTTTRSATSLKVLMPGKVESNLTIAEKDSKNITAESIDSIKNLTTEMAKDKYKASTTFIASVKNKILKLEEKVLFTGVDGLTFNLNQIHNLNLNTGVNTKGAIALTDLPVSKTTEINKIETTITTTGAYKDGVSTIVQKTKTLSKADNTFAVKDRTYVIDANKLVFTEAISDFGPKSSISFSNGIRSEITVNAYLKAGKTYIEKKVVKTLADGSLVDGVYSGLSVVGSSTTTSEIDGNNFSYISIPLITNKTIRPTRTCDIATLEKNIEAKSSTANGRWLASKNVNIRFAERYYVLSVLSKVFGSSVLGTAYSINSLNTVFGGNFDNYDLVRDDLTSSKVINTSPEGYALIAANTTPNTDVIGPLNPIRLATTIRVCEDIAKSNTFILNAIRNATGDQSISTASIPYPFKQDFINAHNLFYPTDPISEDTTNALICVADAETSAIDQWRNVFLTLCITPEWQIP
ncbi:hypothetical protein SHI21_02655 [Bacteriovorax sp. PP10]|uniref:Cytochrome c domain-containing protein n=1 Tax=Bacteriovorax antarcticus TaxID=3088717 RepID=A0ABU5VTV7_9BACT|nr:hypothetical protein [Bacteriovorax sp. PP10]MEA9355080.1 hypothetical protein [Bacteriovorax sp. PP10]